SEAIALDKGADFERASLQKRFTSVVENFLQLLKVQKRFTWFSSAYGQAGDLMIELISQPDDAPSVLRERYTRHQYGLHHVASFVENLPAAIEAERQRGHQIALEARTTTGVDFAMIDTVAALGHMLEIYEPNQALKDFYAFVRRKAEGWDGSHPVRVLR
ncbi:MAG: hypothetical protein EBT64_05770, partial [Gammaproteobacteria bacterium]|nr:hypothetical protein [Gammaproteobacteria bacterium]